MRQIGTLPTEQEAQRFEDHLLTLGVKAMIEANADDWSVWVFDEDEVQKAKQELAGFRENPNDPRYDQSRKAATGLRREAAKQGETARKNVVDVSKRWQKPLASQCPVTFALIAVSVIVTVTSTDWNNLSRLGDKTEPLLTHLYIAPMFDRGAGAFWEPQKGLQAILHGELWRLVTPIFIHLHILHILFNMLWLRELGSVTESRRGSLRFGLMVLAIAVSSNLGQYLMNRILNEGGPNFGGMSGVVYGLFGYIWIKSRFEPASGFLMSPNIVFWMIGWFVLCLTGNMGPVANTVHGVGLAVGMVLGYVPTLWRNLQRE